MHCDQVAWVFILQYASSYMQSPLCVLICAALQMAPGSQPGADNDLLHVTISSEEMQVTRMDQLILTMPHASHVLDVYSNRRVDKRRLLASGYLRFQRVMDSATAPTASEPAPQSSSLSQARD